MPDTVDELLAIDPASCGERKNARARVFEAAQCLFYERGIRAVGIDEIVARAGVTKPSLYRAFASKDALVAACLEDFTTRATAAVEAEIAAAGPDPRARLMAVVSHHATKMASEHFRGCPMSNIAVEFADTEHPGRLVAGSCKGALRTRVTQLAAELPAADPEDLADGLLMLIEGAFSLHHVFGCPDLAASLERNAARLIQAHAAR